MLAQHWSALHSYPTVCWERSQDERNGSHLPTFEHMTQTWTAMMAVETETSLDNQFIEPVVKTSGRQFSPMLWLSTGF